VRKRRTATYLAERIEDGVTLRSSRHWSHAVHLCNGGGSRAHNVREASDDLLICCQSCQVEGLLKDATYGKWALSNNDEGTIDDGDGLSRSLESLALIGDHLDVVNNLGRCDLCHYGSAQC
jgi:hypothetical protein